MVGRALSFSAAFRERAKISHVFFALIRSTLTSSAIYNLLRGKKKEEKKMINEGVRKPPCDLRINGSVSRVCFV
ncbi:hypothetical protein PUN28_018624 [Cardiocondyla obscurior]|uniref:Secreted protein n=1 Tax=Cardiocondyla obscurior TaxID=286306 RepID=A0AAW2EHF2_9HYME